jgi:hypothetical protein
MLLPLMKVIFWMTTLIVRLRNPPFCSDRIRVLSWPSSVIRPLPSMMVSTFHVRSIWLSILIVTGSGPQSKVTTPPGATALRSAASVQDPGVPFPTTVPGFCVVLNGVTGLWQMF